MIVMAVEQDLEQRISEALVLQTLGGRTESRLIGASRGTRSSSGAEASGGRSKVPTRARRAGPDTT